MGQEAVLDVLKKEGERGTWCTIKYISYLTDLPEGTVVTNLSCLAKQGLVEKASLVDYVEKDSSRIDMRIPKPSGSIVRRFAAFHALDESAVQNNLVRSLRR